MSNTMNHATDTGTHELLLTNLVLQAEQRGIDRKDILGI
jgi:hypothetical protein